MTLDLRTNRTVLRVVDLPSIHGRGDVLVSFLVAHVSGTAMRKTCYAWMLAMAACGIAHAGASPAGYHVIVPVRDAAGRAVEARDPDGRMVPVAKLAQGGDEARLAPLLQQGLPALLPAIDARARRATTHQVNCRAWADGITIFISDEDGGYARKDFYLESQSGHRTLCADYYIDITLDDASLKDGQFEEVVSHEYGHVLLRRLLGPVPPTPSRHGHAVTTVTDPVTAFDEGFGIQMQPLAARLTATPGFVARAEGRTAPSAADTWLSRRETWLRETVVPHGDFVFDAIAPSIDTNRYARWLKSETSSSADLCHVKSANAMMASEGVAATFFFRLLDGGPEGQAIDHRYQQLIAVLAQMREWPKSAPLVTLVNRWGELYPGEKGVVTRLFLDTTYGATASVAAREEGERLSCLGAQGNLDAFAPALKAYRSTLAALSEQVTKGQTALDAGLGPELWLADPDIRIPAQPWSKERDLPLVLDLNAATEPALALLLNDDDLAGKLVDARNGVAFASLDDAVRRAGLSPAQTAHLQELALTYGKLPNFVRR